VSFLGVYSMLQDIKPIIHQKYARGTYKKEVTCKVGAKGWGPPVAFKGDCMLVCTTKYARPGPDGYCILVNKKVQVQVVYFVLYIRVVYCDVQARIYKART